MQDIISQAFSYARGMWRFRWSGLAVSILACLLAWAAALLVPDKYQATSRVQIDTSSVLKPLLKGLAADSEAIDRVTMITRVMLSRPNLEKVIKDADLDLKAKDPRELERLLIDVRERITIAKPFDSRKDETSPIVFLDISFTDREPKVAHKVVQLLVNTLVENTLGENRSDTTEAQKFLMAQIKDYEQQLKFAEDRLATFKKENVGLLPGQGGDYYMRLQQANEELDALKNEHALASGRYNVIKQQLDAETPLIGGSGDPRLIALDEQIAANDKKLNDLLLQYTDSHPDVAALRRTNEQLTEKRTQLAAEVEGNGTRSGSKFNGEINPAYQNAKIALQSAEVEVQALVSKISKQQSKINELQNKVGIVPEVEARLKDLDRNYDVIKQQYVTLLSRLESASLSEDVRTSNFDIKFQIVDPAVVPATPSAPNRLALLAGATAAGIGAGVALMFVLNMLFPVYITTREVTAVTGYPVLGRVSMIFPKKEIAKRRFGYWVFGAAYFSLIVFAALLMVYSEAAVDLVRKILGELLS